MSKSKKAKKNKVIVPTANIETAGTQQVNYLGEVTVKLARGNKTLSTKKYTNSGMPGLFRFICNALAGSFSEVACPCQIKLFNYLKADDLQDEDSAPSNFNWVTAHETNTLRGCTPYVVYDATPKVKYVADGYYTTTYHFRVPFALISEARIHAVGIYPTNVIADGSDAYAYYLFTDNGSDGQPVWSPIELPSSVGNYSIIIDWTMAVMNKTN